MALDPARARSALATIRLTVGTSAVLTPRLTGRVFGLNPAENPEAPLLGRLFGIRNAVLGLSLLDGSAREGNWPAYNVAIDVLDIAALLAAGVRGYVPKRTVLLGTATAVAAAALGMLAMDGER